MVDEQVRAFNYNDLRVLIFAEDPDKEDTGFYFQIIEYDENNIPMDIPIYESNNDYICESSEQAEDDAKEWIDFIYNNKENDEFLPFV
jgi:hypothetical protein